MHAEDSATNQAAKWHPIEGILKSVPKTHGFVATVALFEEAVDAIDCRTFMIAAKHEEVFWILDFVAKHEAYSFNVLSSAINVVPKEEVVGFWRETIFVKYSKQIGILTMDITADNDRGLDFNKRWLIDEDFFCRLTKLLKFLLTDLKINEKAMLGIYKTAKIKKQKNQPVLWVDHQPYQHWATC